MTVSHVRHEHDEQYVESLHVFSHQSRSDDDGQLIAPEIELECAMIADMLHNGLDDNHMIIMENTEVVNGRVVIVTDMHVCRVNGHYLNGPCGHPECEQVTTMGQVKGSSDDVKDWLTKMGGD